MAQTGINIPSPAQLFDQGKAIGSGLQQIGKGVPSAILTGLNAIGDFFQRLTQANTWLRIGEVILGVLLVSVGLAKMTGANIPVASSIAKAVA